MSLEYLKDHRVLSAKLDTRFLSVLEINLNELWLVDITTNFTSLVPYKSLSIAVKKRSWVKRWLEEHKELRVYFWMNYQTSIPELIGYSKDTIVYPELELKEDLENKEKGTFIDFTDIEPSSFSGKYITGWVDPTELNMAFPLLFKKHITLIYSRNLWGDPEFSTYMTIFNLTKPISIDLLEKISKYGKYLVIKKVGNAYEICGYTNRKI